MLIYRVIFHINHKKFPFLAILTLYLILGKIQDGGQDSDPCWWRHRPPAAPPPIKYIPHLVMKIKGFPLKVKSFRNTATLRRGSIKPLRTTVGVTAWQHLEKLKINLLTQPLSFLKSFDFPFFYWVPLFAHVMVLNVIKINSDKAGKQFSSYFATMRTVWIAGV